MREPDERGTGRGLDFRVLGFLGWGTATGFGLGLRRRLQADIGG